MIGTIEHKFNVFTFDGIIEWDNSVQMPVLVIKPSKVKTG